MSRKSQLFSQVPAPKVSRNLFDLSHEVKMSGKFGYLYPCLVVDTLPGDTFRDQMTALVRFAPMLAPVMHRIDVTTHFFFVPNRLLSDHWEDFITGGQDGLQAPVLPYITPASVLANDGDGVSMALGTLWDYLGLPPLSAVPVAGSTQQLSILPFRAYAKIWNDYYRDPNFDQELDLGLELAGDVADTYWDAITGAGLWQIRRRGFEKDYFTACLPWAQRGAEVLMPISGIGSVTYRPATNVYTSTGGVPVADQEILTTGTSFMDFQGADAPLAARFENIDEVIIDESDITINDLRRSIAIQQWLENNARGGARYVEQIQSHFNQRVPDYRLQRAEYLGGGRQPVVISEVVTTAPGDFQEGELPPGDLAGHGISVGKTNQFTYKCQEHGWIIGILSVMPRTAYSQGIDRMWTRSDKFDFGWPELARLGEQEVLSRELFFSFDADDDDQNTELFGYLPRYAEYKFKNDRIAGDFRSTLDIWHLGRIFSARPALDAQFTTLYEEGDATENNFRRIFSVVDGTDYLWMQLFHRMTAKRPLPYFGVPQL